MFFVACVGICDCPILKAIRCIIWIVAPILLMKIDDNLRALVDIFALHKVFPTFGAQQNNKNAVLIDFDIVPNGIIGQFFVFPVYQVARTQTA